MAITSTDQQPTYKIKIAVLRVDAARVLLKVGGHIYSTAEKDRKHTERKISTAEHHLCRTQGHAINTTGNSTSDAELILMAFALHINIKLIVLGTSIE